MAGPRRSKTRKAAEQAGYRSGFEARIAEQLTESGIDFEYEPKEGIIEYEVHELRKYLPDFKIGKMIIECKGRFTSADRKKMRLIRQQYPKLDIRMLFMSNNKLNPRSKTRYSDWAEKNGYKWAIKRIPKEWLP